MASNSPKPPKTGALVLKRHVPSTSVSIAKTMEPVNNTKLAEPTADSRGSSYLTSALEAMRSTSAKPVTLPALPKTSSTNPLGTLRTLPGEVRELIWKNILHNPLPDRPSSMSLLRSSKAIFIEAIRELDHDLSVRFILDPARPLSILVRDRNNAKLPTLDLPSAAINREHALWKIPMHKVNDIRIDIFAAVKSEPGELADLSTTIDRLVAHLTAIWPFLPPVHIYMRKSGDRVWRADGWRRRKSVSDWQWDIHICLPFLPLRNCKSMKITFEGHDDPNDIPWKILRITSCIERAAISTQPYGEKVEADFTSLYSAGAFASLQSGRNWGRWDMRPLLEKGNDETIEHLLNLARRITAPRVEELANPVEWPLRAQRFEEAFPALATPDKGEWVR
jgi:hypothetical protein